MHGSMFVEELLPRSYIYSINNLVHMYMCIMQLPSVSFVHYRSRQLMMSRNWGEPQ